MNPNCEAFIKGKQEFFVCKKHVKTNKKHSFLLSIPFIKLIKKYFVQLTVFPFGSFSSCIGNKMKFTSCLLSFYLANSRLDFPLRRRKSGQDNLFIHIWLETKHLLHRRRNLCVCFSLATRRRRRTFDEEFRKNWRIIYQESLHI